jgi:hypothetical protein
LQEKADDAKPRILAECAKRDDTVGPALEDRKGTLAIAQRKAWRQDLRLPRCCHGSSAYNLRITRLARQARARALGGLCESGQSLANRATDAVKTGHGDDDQIGKGAGSCGFAHDAELLDGS